MKERRRERSMMKKRWYERGANEGRQNGKLKRRGEKEKRDEKARGNEIREASERGEQG
jgi:hypothetical protein